MMTACLITYRVIELLLKYKSVWIADDDEDGNTPLHLAALNGHPKCAKILLDSQADYHAKWVHQDCSKQIGSGTAILHSFNNHTHFYTFSSSSSS